MEERNNVPKKVRRAAKTSAWRGGEGGEEQRTLTDIPCDAWHVRRRRKRRRTPMSVCRHTPDREDGVGARFSRQKDTQTDRQGEREGASYVIYGGSIQEPVDVLHGACFC